MKTLLRVSALATCGLIGTIFADNFKSLTIPGSTPSETIRVHGDQFMVIRNFTQDMAGGTTRGFVTVTSLGGNGGTAMVLIAALLDPNMSPEIINNVTIAGPADVTFTCGNTTGNCFASYKKEGN